jgi:hypothetical protein
LSATGIAKQKQYKTAERRPSVPKLSPRHRVSKNDQSSRVSNQNLARLLAP